MPNMFIPQKPLPPKTMIKQQPTIINTPTKPIIKKDNCSQFTSGVLEESYSAESSKQACWWLDSGGIFTTKNNIGKSLEGNLKENSFWKIKYMANNPEDTNDGFRPQNIFRLVNRKKWKNVSQSMLFKINNYDLSNSKNRNSSNGVLLMSRYINGDNLYYAGLRVDGTAIIKKKIGGQYITLASAQYNTQTEYDPIKNPILLPLNRWLGQKFITKNNTDGSVNLKLFVNLGNSEEWKLIIDINDSIQLSGKPPLTNEGNIGIRADFMDIEISNFISSSP